MKENDKMLGQDEHTEGLRSSDGPPPQPAALYIALGPDGACKMGTCAHCVIEEQERPERAWDGAPHHAGK